MGYNEFIERVMARIREELGEGYRVETHKVPKNNGVFLDGLTVRTKGEPAFPVVYLDGYYEQYQEGTALEGIAEEILGILQDRQEFTMGNIIGLADFDQMREKVVCKLINAEANQELLMDVPHIPWLDLAVVFYLMLGQNQHGYTTALVHNCHMKLWGTTIEELEALAKRNIQNLIPAEVKSMDEVMRGLVCDTLGGDLSECILEQMTETVTKPPLYIMSNAHGINGAVCMLMDGALGELADRIGKDLVILPSSVHEILIIPFGEDVDFSELLELVTEVNQSEVPKEDVLSNHVYHYSRKEKRVCMVDVS